MLRIDNQVKTKLFKNLYPTQSIFEDKVKKEVVKFGKNPDFFDNSKMFYN